MRRFLVALAMLVAVAVAGPAHAHGDLRSSDPNAGARLQAPPSVVELDLAEPPTADSRFVVIDGCRDEVAVDFGRDGSRVTLPVAGGQPGRWRVEYRVISAVDGHLVRGDFAFRVAGQRDCSEPAASPEPAETDDEVAAPPGEEGGSGPLVPLVAVGGGIVALAFVIRKMMAA